MARTKVRNRPLEKSYAIVYLDALRIKAKEDGKSCMKSVYVALGVNFEEKKEVLGLWIAQTEGDFHLHTFQYRLADLKLKAVLVNNYFIIVYSEVWFNKPRLASGRLNP